MHSSRKPAGIRLRQPESFLSHFSVRLGSTVGWTVTKLSNEGLVVVVVVATDREVLLGLETAELLPGEGGKLLRNIGKIFLYLNQKIVVFFHYHSAV